MTTQRWQDIKRIFHAALERSAGDRPAFVDEACGDDTDLRAEVERMLREHARSGQFMQTQPLEGAIGLHSSAMPTRSETSEAPGATRPPPLPSSAFEGYQLIRELSHGGQGVVYEAIQAGTKRHVAIKVLLEGIYASDAARRRFEREIELAARLKHANIVSVFESGQTADGRQFYAMDYVAGLPLNQFVQRQRLTLEQSLRLFATICEAVQYAHQRGVIHRDLKPSNILIDEDGSPKVLDFGLAKQVADSHDRLLTISQQAIGTLPYMSPEQSRGELDEIDTRTDVYALGVILYELLTGRYPYPVTGQMADVLRNIAQTAPTPPSRCWSRAAGVIGRDRDQRRGAAAHGPGPATCPIDKDVETIVLKALAKERDRRYASAGDLARDVARYLAGEAIDARRDSRWYVFRKFVNRNPLPTAITAAVVLATVGAVWSIWLAKDEARRQERRARTSETIQRSNISFIVSGVEIIYAYMKTTFNENPDLARQLEPKFAQVRIHVANALNDTQGFTQAEKVAREVLEWSLANTGPEHFITVLIRMQLGRALLGQQRYAEAERELNWVFQYYDRVGDPTGGLLACLPAQRLVELYEAQNQPAKAEPFRAMANSNAWRDRPRPTIDELKEAGANPTNASILFPAQASSDSDQP